jgi:hypothetical protein
MKQLWIGDGLVTILDWIIMLLYQCQQNVCSDLWCIDYVIMLFDLFLFHIDGFGCSFKDIGWRCCMIVGGEGA